MALPLAAQIPLRQAKLNFSIREISSRSDKLRFVKFPWTIYKNDPYWVPPLIHERLDFVDPQKNPSFEHMDLALFVAETTNARGEKRGDRDDRRAHQSPSQRVP